MKKNKYIKTKRLDYIKAIKRFFFLIPIIIYIINIIRYFYSSSTLYQIVPFKYYLLLNIYYTIYSTLKYAIIPYIIISIIAKNIKNDVKFNTVEDFEYYRDKLNDLNASDISLLMDLKLEHKKDIAGNLMQFELMGYLKKENDNYIVKDDILHDPNLSEADKFFLANIYDICNNNIMAIHKWHMMALDEAKDKNLITDIGVYMKTPKVKILFILAFFIALASFCFLFITHGWKVIGKAVMSISGEDGIPLNRESIAAFFNYHPQMVLYISAVLNIAICLVFMNAYPLLWVGAKIASIIFNSRYKRTERGNKLTEYIYGMQNFIHDFSNLSDYDKEALVLWDKYLIYAVILEENTKILDEMKEYKSKIKTTI